MTDAQTIDIVLPNTTQTIQTNEPSFDDKYTGMPAEPPPQYDAVLTEKAPFLEDTSTVTPVENSIGQQFGHLPVHCTCPNCHQDIVSRVEKTNGVITWILCIVLLLLGCWLGCCLIPFCINDLKDKTHYCPQCGTVLASKKII